MNAPSRTRSGALCHLTRHGTAAPVGPVPGRQMKETTMLNKKTLLAAVATLGLIGTTGIASATDRDHDGRPDHSWAEHHDHDGYRDRYWRPGFRGYIARDRVFFNLRHRGYVRFVGDPYFYHGRYVVRTYNRWGRIVFVEINPYDGAFIGEIRF